MATDPRIALGVQPMQLENPLQRYGNALKIQSAKMEMDTARRAEKEREAINALYQQAYAGGGDIENALLQGAASQGLGYKIPEFQKSFAESKTAKFNQLKTLAELQKRTATIIMQNPDFAEPAIADFERQTGQDLSSLRMQIGQLRGNPDAVRRLAAGYALDADKMLPKTEVRDMGGAVTATNIDPITGRPVEQYSLGDKSMTPGEAANLPINQARLANERQRLTNEQQRFALDMRKFEREASGEPTLKPLTAAQEVKLRDALAKDYKQVQSVVQSMEDLLASTKAVRDTSGEDPVTKKKRRGLEGATGYSSYIPAIPDSEKATAQVRLQNLRGKVTALGKAAAAAGGAIGPVATQEWKILADQIAALDEVKGAEPLLEQIGLIEEQARGAAQRIKDAYRKQHSEDFQRFPQFEAVPELRDPYASAGTPSPAAPAAPSGASVTNW